MHHLERRVRTRFQDEADSWIGGPAERRPVAVPHARADDGPASRFELVLSEERPLRRRSLVVDDPVSIVPWLAVVDALSLFTLSRTSAPVVTRCFCSRRLAVTSLLHHLPYQNP